MSAAERSDLERAQPRVCGGRLGQHPQQRLAQIKGFPDERQADQAPGRQRDCAAQLSQQHCPAPGHKHLKEGKVPEVRST